MHNARMAKGSKIEVVVQEAEAALIRAAAKKAGLSVSAWVRMIALAAAKGGK